MNWEVNGIDVSGWQGKMDWDTAKQNIQFAYIRASAGGFATDSQFARNSSELERLGIPYGSYHFFKADDDPTKQANLFASLASGTLPPVVDVEHSDNLNKTQLNNVLTTFINTFESKTNRKLNIYSRATFWDGFLPKTNWGNKKDLWVAHYTSAPVPLIPGDWISNNNPRKWVFWQWSADGNGLGATYGADSQDIDLDRYNGSVDDFNHEFNTQIKALAGGGQGGAAKPDHSFVEVTATLLNVRTQPVVDPNTLIGTVPTGTILEVVTQNNGWVTVIGWTKPGLVAPTGGLFVYTKTNPSTDNLIGPLPANYQIVTVKQDGAWNGIGVFVNQSFVAPA